MARQPLDPPGDFARLVAREIRREMGDLRMTAAGLARVLGKSQKYATARLDMQFEFTLNDVENFALRIGSNPEEFIGRIDRGSGVVFPPAATVSISTPAPDVRGDEDTSGIDELGVLTKDELAQRDVDLAALRDQETPGGNDARPRP